jgi:hypothetical protein
MGEDEIIARYQDLAGQLIALAEKMDEAKKIYDWFTWVRKPESVPDGVPIAEIDSGVQVIESIRDIIQVANRDAVYNLAYGKPATVTE